ncbi:glutathione S-transferase family protein [Mameliella alba]|nr:glutathione S-transferase family protein [Mameliella alba]MBY6168258.1 glutathione S-transferase family protein [Mameliella alba]MBY6173279.1 glutathione S-transferase family protein [Mameliella alba]
MLKLMSFPPGMQEPSLSPFCVKAMILLNMAGQSWAPDWQADPRKAPLRKLPALRTPEGIVPDSGLILRWLTGQGADLFPGLGLEERVQAHMLMRMVEDSLRHGLTHDRWARDDCWATMKFAFFASVPAPFRVVVSDIMRRQVVQGLKTQGIARFSEADRLTLLGADLDALTVQLGEGEWLFGDRPTAADATTLPVLSMIDRLPVQTGLRANLRARGNLMDYVARGRARLYAGLPVSA